MSKTKRLPRPVRRGRKRFAVFVAVYFVVAVAGLQMRGESNRYEYFPFSAWPLFCITPTGDRPDYGVRFREGTRWTYLEESELPHAHSIEAYHLLQAIGRAGVKRDRERQNRLVRQLRGRYLRGLPEGTQVQVVRRRFDPLERYRTGVIDFEEPILSFARSEPR